jgi:hypothetical protein
METPIETAAMRWHRARKALQKAKDALKAYRETHGGCEAEGEDNGDREPKGICYHDTQDQNEWCETCLGSEPLFQAKRKAGQEQGAAMRQLMRLCGQETVQIEMEEQHA